jgi:hypothetical protein
MSGRHPADPAPVRWSRPVRFLVEPLGEDPLRPARPRQVPKTVSKGAKDLHAGLPASVKPRSSECRTAAWEQRGACHRCIRYPYGRIRSWLLEEFQRVLAPAR